MPQTQSPSITTASQINISHSLIVFFLVKQNATCLLIKINGFSIFCGISNVMKGQGNKLSCFLSFSSKAFEINLFSVERVMMKSV